MISIQYNFPYISIDGMTEREQTAINESLNQFFYSENYSDEQKRNYINNIFSALMRSLNNVDNSENQLQPQTTTEVTISNPNDKTEVAIKTNISLDKYLKEAGKASTI